MHKLLIIVTLVLFSTLIAQNSELKKIQVEIEQLRVMLKDEVSREKRESSQLKELEESLSRSKEIYQKINSSKAEIEKIVINRESTIQKLNSDIILYQQKQNENQQIISEIESKLAARYRVLYIKRNQKSLPLFYDFNSFNKMMMKRKYFSIIKDLDKRNIDHYRLLKDESIRLSKELLLKKELLAVEVNSLHKTALSKEELLNIEKQAYLELVQKKEQKESQLAQINQKKSEYLAQITQKEQAAKEMEALMRRLEEQRKKREEEKKSKIAAQKRETKKKITQSDKKVTQSKEIKQFAQLKKGIDWPLKGTIVTAFGEIINQVTKTVTFNPGVEIKAQNSLKVSAVLTGEVVKIFFLRGYGNTLILEHDNGFYTVYSNLEKIYTKEGDKIDTGDNIASIDSKNGKLHFEIWHKKDKLNPTEWLK